MSIDRFRSDLEAIRGLVSLGVGDGGGARRRRPRRRRRTQEAAQYVEMEPGVWVNPATKIPEATTPASDATARKRMRDIEAEIRRTHRQLDGAGLQLLARALGLTDDQAAELGRLWNG